MVNDTTKTPQHQQQQYFEKKHASFHVIINQIYLWSLYTNGHRLKEEWVGHQMAHLQILSLSYQNTQPKTIYFVWLRTFSPKQKQETFGATNVLFLHPSMRPNKALSARALFFVLVVLSMLQDGPQFIGKASTLGIYHLIVMVMRAKWHVWGGNEYDLEPNFQQPISIVSIFIFPLTKRKGLGLKLNLFCNYVEVYPHPIWLLQRIWWYVFYIKGNITFMYYLKNTWQVNHCCTKVKLLS